MKIGNLYQARLVTLILFFYFPYTIVTQAKNPKLNISHLVNNFYVYTTYSDYKGTPFSANGLYLVTSDGVVMIDTPWDTTQFQPLLDSIKFRHKQDVKICIATHSHDDRTAGLEYYKQRGIKTYTTQQTDLICKEKNHKRAEFLLSNDSIFKIGDYTFQTYYPGPGHTVDNIVLWFEKDKVLYGGCLIKSTQANDLGNIAEADLSQYSNSIQNILKKFGQPAYVIPGHQSWKNPKSMEHTIKLIKKQNK